MYKIQPELPRLCIPAAFMIDDSAVEQKKFYLYLAHLTRLIKKYRLKGKMSITPWVSGRGPIDDKKHPPLSRTGLKKLVTIINRDIAPRMDINPEMITHSKTLNLKTGKLTDIPEWEWSRKQSVRSLTAYVTRAMSMLEHVGIRTNGITSPVDFGKGNEKNYARAVSNSAMAWHQQNIAWYYLNNELAKPAPRPVITYLSPDKKKCAIDMVSCLNDQLLAEIVGARGIKARRIRPLADRYITEDGKKGRLATVIRHKGYCIFHTHWWALYNHGKKRGFKVYDLIFHRLQKHYAHQLVWMKCSDIARYRAAAAVTQLRAQSSAAGIVLTIKAPIACPDFTFSVGPITRPIRQVSCNNQPLPQASNKNGLTENSWQQKGRILYLCIPLAASANCRLTLLF